MPVSKSIIFYLIGVIIALSIGAIAYQKVVSEQTPSNTTDEPIAPKEQLSGESTRIENQPLVVTSTKTIQ